ncbi:hypothetical protein V6N13_119025 [Hibiscus sabdariffa]
MWVEILPAFVSQRLYIWREFDNVFKDGHKFRAMVKLNQPTTKDKASGACIRGGDDTTIKVAKLWRIDVINTMQGI